MEFDLRYAIIKFDSQYLLFFGRGEKAFCSSSCRAQEILYEEEIDKPAIIAPHSPKLSYQEEDIFLTGMAVST